MTTLLQLRVELDDRPGALAQAARILADEGVNILDIAIHEVDGDVVVDELLVEAPDDWDLTAARQLLDASAVYLLSSAPVRQREDPVVTALGWVRELLAQPAHDAALARVVARAAGASKACVLPVERAGQVAAGRLALSRGGPVVQRTADLPVQVASAGDSLRWLVAVPDDRADPTVMAFATRPLSLRFTATEVARAEAAVQVWRALTREVASERWTTASGA